jgi:hypothetical protein
MTLLSQLDQRWANILLGYNSAKPYTIGNFGCLITCLSSYVDKTPPKVNELLKANGGFAAGSGNFIWGKSSVLGLTEQYVSPRYTGPVTTQGLQKLKDILDAGYPVLCEVDFNPNTSGEEMHFVLIIRHEGDSFYAMDPWVGEIVNISVYGGPQRAIIQFRQYDKKLVIPAPQPQPQTATISDDEKRSLQVIKDAKVSFPQFQQLEAFSRDLVEKYTHPAIIAQSIAQPLANFSSSELLLELGKRLVGR